jgi:dTDP-4-dehydrorhamnose reductase
MKVFVTGAGGLLGHRVAHALVRKGHKVLLTSREKIVADAPAPVEKCDLTDITQVRDLVGIFGPDAIVHCAGLADADSCHEDRGRAWTQNVGMTAHLAYAITKRDCHLITVSTDHVFEGTKGPYAEDDIAGAINEYGLSKMGAERTTAKLTRTWSIARTAVLLGWPTRGRSNFGAWLLGELAAKKPVRLFEDQLITPSLASHVASQLVELVERRLTGKWHLCGAETMDRMAFGRALCEVFGFQSTLLDVGSAKKGEGFASRRPLRAGLRSDKAARELEAKPLTLQQTLEGLRAEYERR